MTAPETGTATFKAFARILGERSPSYVTQLKDQGRLVLTDDDKRVRVKESLALIRETADPSKAGVAARHAAQRDSASEPGAGEGVEEGEGLDAPLAAQDGHASRRSRALADKAEWDAKAAERDYLVSMKQLLNADQVAASVAAAVSALRGRLETLPYDLAPQLAPIADEGQIRTMLSDEVEAALGECARQLTALARAEALA